MCARHLSPMTCCKVQYIVRVLDLMLFLDKLPRNRYGSLSVGARGEAGVKVLLASCSKVRSKLLFCGPLPVSDPQVSGNVVQSTLTNIIKKRSTHVK